MNPTRCFSSLLTILAFSFNSHGVTFQNLSEQDFKKVVKDLSANFVHTSVSGASPLGDIFGFEIGIVGGVTNTPELNRFSQEVDPASKVQRIPHAELLGVVSLPLAITLEAGIVPKVGSDDAKFSSYSLAGKWSPSELFFDLPVSVAGKLHLTQANAEFKDDPGNVPTTYKYDQSLFGGTLLVSKNFAIFEPYLGYGFVNAKGEMDVTGSNSVFTAGQSASAKTSSALFLAGTEIKLLVLKLGVEYSHMFDTSRFTGKVSFYF